jgi:hypothetical protein
MIGTEDFFVDYPAGSGPSYGAALERSSAYPAAADRSAGLDPSDRAEVQHRPHSRRKRPHNVRDPGSAASSHVVQTGSARPCREERNRALIGNRSHSLRGSARLVIEIHIGEHRPVGIATMRQAMENDEASVTCRTA